MSPRIVETLRTAATPDAAKGHFPPPRSFAGADLIGEFYYRCDQLPAVEQSAVVVVRILDLDDARRTARRFGDGAALLRRHDRVSGAVDHRGGHPHPRQVLDEPVAVAKERPDGQEGVVD